METKRIHKARLDDPQISTVYPKEQHLLKSNITHPEWVEDPDLNQIYE